MISIKVLLTLLAASTWARDTFSVKARELQRNKTDKHISKAKSWWAQSNLGFFKINIITIIPQRFDNPSRALLSVGSGTILTNRWILSAAHILNGRMQTTYQPLMAGGPGDSGGGLLCRRNNGQTYVFGIAKWILKYMNGYPLEEHGTVDLPMLYISVH